MSLKRNSLRIILVIVPVIILVRLIHTFLVDPWIRDKANQFLARNDISVHIGKVRTSIFSLSAVLENIRIEDVDRPRMSLNGEIRSISISGINPLQVKKKKYNFSEITITGLNLAAGLKQVDDPALKVFPADINIKRIILSDSEIKIDPDTTHQAFAFKGASFVIDSIAFQKNDTITSGIFRISSLRTDSLIFISPDSVYTQVVHGISYSYGRRLEADSILIIPNLTEREFAGKITYQQNYIKGTLTGISIDGISLPEIILSRNIAISHAQLKKMDLYVSRDKRKEFLQTVKPEFQDMLKNYKGLIRIDSITLSNADVIYAFHEEESDKPAWITFNRINATITRIHNDTDIIREKKVLGLVASGYLMNKGLIEIRMTAPLNDPDNTFDFRGTISGMDLPELNPVLENSAFVTIKSGKAIKNTFSFIANSERSSGEMVFLYDSLSIALKDTDGNKLKIKSFIANLGVINSNPSPGKEPVKAKIEFERDPHRYIFHYWYKSFISGIRNSVLVTR